MVGLCNERRENRGNVLQETIPHFKDSKSTIHRYHLVGLKREKPEA